MTKHNNDEHNWCIIDLGTDDDPLTRLVMFNQAENVAKAAAENYANNNNPNHAVALYQRVSVVQTVPVAKWL